MSEQSGKPTLNKEYLDRIKVVKADISQMDVDAVVNAANEGLRHGSGVCGAIFEAAGPSKLQKACAAIGHCATGNAVITPGFNLKARYVIHAVGPKWSKCGPNEPELLASCYTRSLDLALENDCNSIAFPLISSGIYGWPKDDAWHVALTACASWLSEHAEHGDQLPEVTFCVMSNGSLELASDVRADMQQHSSSKG